MERYLLHLLLSLLLLSYVDFLELACLSPKLSFEIAANLSFIELRDPFGNSLSFRCYIIGGLLLFWVGHFCSFSCGFVGNNIATESSLTLSAVFVYFDRLSNAFLFLSLTISGLGFRFPCIDFSYDSCWFVNCLRCDLSSSCFSWPISANDDYLRLGGLRMTGYISWVEIAWSAISDVFAGPFDSSS